MPAPHEFVAQAADVLGHTAGMADIVGRHLGDLHGRARAPDADADEGGDARVAGVGVVITILLKIALKF